MAGELEESVSRLTAVLLVASTERWDSVSDSGPPETKVGATAGEVIVELPRS